MRCISTFTILLVVASGAGAGNDNVPSAREVIARGKSSLADALKVALRPAGRDGFAALEIAIVVDVTPYTAAMERPLMAALKELDPLFKSAARWRMAPLGGKFRDTARSPWALAFHVPRILRKETPSENTLSDLRRTLARFRFRDATIVYLADWHFEDDHRLEKLLTTLKARSQTLSVVGSEAAFSRAWNDGFFPRRPRVPSVRGGTVDYDLRIGRNPFGTNEAHAPWHGGDTAYPHLPAYLSGAPWQSEFSVMDHREELREELSKARARDEPGFEDLRERLRDVLKRSKADPGSHPLPSAFGPYGLMRLAAATGGRYVLWSWNPSGRSNVKYDYARCDRFPPDLRSRRAIRFDLTRRPLARALLDAWQAIAHRKVALARITPPMDKDRITPRQMVRVQGQRCFSCLDWDDRTEYLAFLRDIQDVLAALDGAIRKLDSAIERVPKSPSDIDRRLLADAHLFRHMLAVQRFSLGEAALVAKHIPPDAWDHPDVIPALWKDDFLLRGSDPGKVKPRTVRVIDRERGDRLVEDRRFLLTRYKGTPVGETVARNGVVTYRLGWGTKVSVRPGGGGVRNPAQSGDGEGATTPPEDRAGGGGSSPDPGPSSGG